MHPIRLILGGALGEVLSGPGMAQAPPEAAPCTVQEISRRTLSLAEDLELYVAPDVFVANAAGDALLAGTPNYLFGRGSDGTEFLVAQDSVFGALLKADGSVRVIPSPIDPQLMGAVSAPLPDTRSDRPAIGLTMFGVTTPCVTAISAAFSAGE